MRNGKLSVKTIRLVSLFKLTDYQELRLSKCFKHRFLFLLVFTFAQQNLLDICCLFFGGTDKKQTVNITCPKGYRSGKNAVPEKRDRC